MRSHPEDITDEEIATAVAEHWSIDVDRIEPALIGFGSHHWVATDPSQKTWFVTADRVADDQVRGRRLAAALRTAYRLRHDCALDFVVAPLVGRDDQLQVVTGGYAVALYPYLERSCDDGADTGQLITMVAGIHAATSRLVDVAPIDDFAVDGRDILQAAIADPGSIGDTGPYAGDFAALVDRYRQPITAAFDRYDAMVSETAGDRSDWVVTHGEPKPNNTMITAAGPMLIDWDTVRLAPAARDLWMTGGVQDYTRSTGRTIVSEELDLYRLRWDLEDLGSYSSWFAGRHRRTADTELGWQGCVAICRRFAGE
ncbi:phosphotransferase [Microlunatus soli]|uniref:Spectinomycin phosphotransferase n=1 Tax=Microlunatus soli TaxID=630515 RepID=A0A1H1YBL3_9ACTN|nr:phosphotransferase [Microlunatus soli]SDT18833.1 spectinomycin phosphotransferase [Microlunatus soli]